ncbi:MAG TPA: ABC transporter ATP-binding protein [Acidimicrobiales bacterium]
MTYSLELDRVGKRYSQLQEQAMLLKSLLPGRTAKKRDLWALRDVSFAVEPGETVGIIGRNGAGKTTLLRLCAGVSRPSEGRVRMHGRIAPLISVGVGFHHEMSGRENVLVNGMLLGLSRRQVARRFDEIVAFAELDDLIDTPVKFYSSGQYVRLGFAVAVHSDPEILLVDEVLAVGDLGFQLKCFDRMRELQGAGTTILLVSHSLHAVRLLCPRVLLFTKGRLVMDAPAETAIGRYHELLSTESTDLGAADDRVTVLSRSVENSDGPTHHPNRGDELRYRVDLQFNQAVDSPSISFQVASESGIVCYAMNTQPRQSWRRFKPGDRVELEVAFKARLGGGTYRLSVVVADRNAHTLLATNVGEVPIYIAPRPGSLGWADLEATITASGLELSEYADLTLKADREMDRRPSSEQTQARFADLHQHNVTSLQNIAPEPLPGTS